MNFVDTHCHIQSAGQKTGERSTRELWAKAPELTGDQLVTNALQVGVTKMLCIGCDVEDSKLAIDFSKSRPNCFVSIGIHPHEAAKEIKQLRKFAELALAPKVVAVGECGLDYYYEHSPRADQIEVLEFQLNLAVEAGLPVVFHVRDAFDDFWPIFDSFDGQLKGVLHSFTDTQANLEKAIERGLFVGVNGIATFAKDPAQLEVYKTVPLEHLLLETDAPFLTPAPFRGTINEPQQIKAIAEHLSLLRNESIEQIAEATTQNAHRLFDI